MGVLGFWFFCAGRCWGCLIFLDFCKTVLTCCLLYIVCVCAVGGFCFGGQGSPLKSLAALLLLYVQFVHWYDCTGIDFAFCNVVRRFVIRFPLPVCSCSIYLLLDGVFFCVSVCGILCFYETGFKLVCKLLYCSPLAQSLFLQLPLLLRLFLIGQTFPSQT